MLLSEYVNTHGRGTIQQVSDDSGISYVTVRNAARGMLVKQYDVARRISNATGGKVSITELCEGVPPERKRRRK